MDSMGPRFNLYAMTAAFMSFMLYDFYKEYFTNGGDDPIVLVVATLVLGGGLLFTGISMWGMYRKSRKAQEEEAARKAAEETEA